MKTCPQCARPVDSHGNCPRCLLQVAASVRDMGSSFDESIHPDQIRKNFPQLEILRLVGRGGMGTIYHARQTALDRDVALKIIDPKISKEREFLERFEREAKALAKLSHPNVVTVYDYGQTPDGLAYFIMEYVHGLNLREAMQSMPMSPEDSLEIVKAICDALQYAHSKGVIHRDIKPENVLLSDDGAVKIADFGIAKIGNANSDRRITATRQVLGTVHYLAPEQLESPDEVDHRVDIYALGVIFYELLTKQLPVGHFEVPSLVNPNVGSQIDPIVMRSLHRRPTMRFQSAGEVKQAIAGLLPVSGSLGVEAPVIEPMDASTIVSLPFQSDDWAGFANVHGTVQANANGLVVEYRVVDAIFGSVKSKLRTLSLPWERIASVECRTGIFSGKLKVIADSISVFEDFPGSEEGHLEVNLKTSDFELANRFIEKVRSLRPKLVASKQRAFRIHDASNPTIAILLIFFAILNAGGLAITQVILASLDLEKWIHAICAVAAAITLGPIAVMQLLCGIMYGATASRAVGKAGALVSMIPLTPIALASIPFGFWTRKFFDDPVASALPSSASNVSDHKGWGLTTMIFLRDSKYARLLSALESTGYVFAIGLLSIWLLGFYPSSMNYRIVGKASSDELLGFAKSRLQDLGIKTVNQISEDRFEIRCWARQKKSIAERLALPQKPAIVLLVKSGASASASSDQFFPVSDLESQSVGGLDQRNTATGIELRVNRILSISNEYISTVRIAGNDELVITWSKTGLKELQKTLEGIEEPPILGLAIGGWIEAIESTKDSSERSLRLAWNTRSSKSLASVKASIRGPSLEAELEQID